MFLRRQAVWPLLLAPSLQLTAYAASASSRFAVDFSGNSASGSCGWLGETTINNIFSDTVALAAAGVDLINQYNGQDIRATRLVDAFFQTKSAAKTRLNPTQQNTLKTTYQRIQQWLNNGGAVSNGNLNTTPNLFCHHTWGQPQDATSQVRSNQGDLLSTSDGPVTIRNYPELWGNWVELKAQNPVALPFFSYPHNEYFFAESFGSGPNDFLCTPADSEAQTLFFNQRATITLCPKAFGTSGNTATTNPNIRRLNSVVPAPISQANFQKRLKDKNLAGLQTLDDVASTAVTLYHEVFHLVLGPAPGQSKPGSGVETYGVRACLAAGFTIASFNPETYALAANAWWMTQNTKDAAGNHTEYFQDYATN